MGTFSKNVATLCFVGGFGSSDTWLNTGNSCADVDDIPEAATAEASPKALLPTDRPSFISCGIGFYSPDDNTCALCADVPGLNCTQSATTIATLPISPGYWRSNTASTVVRECWNADACSGGRASLSADSAAAYCTEGYIGPYCAVCNAALDYAPSSFSAYKCERCTASSRAATYAALVAFLLVAIAAAIYLLPVMETKRKSRRAIACGWPLWLRNRLPQCLCRQRQWSFRGEYLRIPIIVVQLLWGIVAATGLQMPANFQAFFTRIAIAPDLFALGCAAHLSFFDKLLLVTLLPLLPVVLLVLSWLLSTRRMSVLAPDSADSTAVAAAAAARAEALRRHWTAFLAFTFLIFGGVSSSIFLTFSCEEFPELGKWYLLMLFVYPIGITGLHAVMIWRKRQLDAHRSNNTTAKVPHECENTFGADRSSNGTAPPNSSVALTDAAAATDPQHGLVHASAFLWSQYTDKADWWELVECTRRLLLTGFIAFILPGRAGQAAVSMLFAFASVVVFTVVRPHKERGERCQYLLGSIIIYMSTATALFMKLNVTGDLQSQRIVGALLIMLNVALIVAAVLQTFGEVWRIVKDAARAGVAVPVEEQQEPRRNPESSRHVLEESVASMPASSY
ncbi:hypothetical protein JKP88DRAFT_316043 [Tribonema minus]|uniref:TRP C-terminal domain-containing protein n=1 Tax=Tribonema minus TaxID=303371 RepID=A0A835YZL6_9STRA|nr:hypothetical protein JKP88DRAFT_316043 [Tribonema minus]